MKAAIFDMDGLMLDTEPLYQQARQNVAKELGYELKDSFYLSLIGRNHIEIESLIIEYFGSNFPMPHFQHLWQSRWKNQVEAFGINRKRGLTELLAWLESLKIPVAVATSSDFDYATLSLKSAGLGSEFEHIVTGDQIANGKPAPDIYLEAADRLKVAPENCIAFEDSEAGVMSASSAGMRVYLVPDLKVPSVATRSRAYSVADSLIEVLDHLQANYGLSSSASSV